MSWERNNYRTEIRNLETGLRDQITGNVTAEDIRDLTSSIITHYRKLIKDFFSSDDGEGDHIKKIYANLHDYNPCTKRINIQDINSAFNTYMNYMNGMKVFIDNVMGRSDDTHGKISKYMDKDVSFVESLFGNGSNAKHVDSVTIQEAMVNLEVLIDFLPKLNSCSDYMDRLLTPCRAETQNKDVCKQLMRFYLLSVLRFTARLIENVFDSFYQIVDTMNGPIIKREVVKEEPFKLFI